MSIADVVVECAETFRRLRSGLAPSVAPNDENHTNNSGFLHKVSSCFERFQLWSSNLGAHRRDKNSLDRRLSEASNLQRRVLQYLKDIRGGLEDIIDIVSGKTTPWDELSVSSSEESDLGDVEAGNATELEQLINYVDNAVSCLLRISTIIQKPAPHDRFIKSGKFDQSFRQKWDEQHVSDKFTNIPDWMAVRLGKANSRRRQFLEYRKNQHEQTANLQSIEGDNKTVISSLPSAVKHNEDLQNAAGAEAARIIDEFDDRESLTSYAETVANEDALLVPAMPENAKDGSLFECPYCFLIVDGIHNRTQWKRHVYTDLQPYICLYSECISADETFARQHSWIKHDTHFHQKRWRCRMGCDSDFISKKHVRDHFSETHGLHGASDHHLDALSVHADVEMPKTLSCPLCDFKPNTQQRYYKHVGQHLEQLALFVIPRDGLDEIEETLEDDEDGADSDADPAETYAKGEGIEHSTGDSEVDPISRVSLNRSNDEERHPDEEHIELEEQTKEQHKSNEHGADMASGAEDEGTGIPRRACIFCRRSHMTCDLKRPCTRCLKRNIGHLCHGERREVVNKSKSGSENNFDEPAGFETGAAQQNRNENWLDAVGSNAEGARQQLLRNPQAQNALLQQNPELGAAINDANRWREAYQQLAQNAEWQRQNQTAPLSEDPFNIEDQRKIEELIRQEKVLENLEKAYNESPEDIFQHHKTSHAQPEFVAQGDEKQPFHPIDSAGVRQSNPPTKPPRTSQYFIPGEGIARTVITADIKHYLGQDALVRPGLGTGEFKGRQGYWITSYRILTLNMIHDLRRDSQRWAQEQQSAGEGRGMAYEDSSTHASRRHWVLSETIKMGEDRPTINLTVLSPSTEVEGDINFPDIPTTISVKALQHAIQNAVPSRPALERIRLVYRGRVVNNEKDTLSTVFGAENIRGNRDQSIHLVLSELPSTRSGEEADREHVKPQTHPPVSLRPLETTIPTQSDYDISSTWAQMPEHLQAAPGYYLAPNGRQHPLSATPQEAYTTQQDPGEASQQAQLPVAQQDTSPNPEPVVAPGHYPVSDKEDTSNHFKIYVGDLSNEINDNILLQAFSTFGPVSEARVIGNMKTGRSRGFGFVAFRKRADAERAISCMDGEWLGSRAVRCSWKKGRHSND